MWYTVNTYLIIDKRGKNTEFIGGTAYRVRAYIKAAIRHVLHDIAYNAGRTTFAAFTFSHYLFLLRFFTTLYVLSTFT